MDNKHFDQLVNAVRQMNRHMSGKVGPGAKTTELVEPDVRAIREAVPDLGITILVSRLWAEPGYGRSPVMGAARYPAEPFGIHLEDTAYRSPITAFVRSPFTVHWRPGR